jgi:hypothetical protein
VERRYSADELYDELQKIVQDAEKNPAYLFNQVEPAPNMPLLFQRREIPAEKTKNRSAKG